MFLLVVMFLCVFLLFEYKLIVVIGCIIVLLLLWLWVGLVVFCFCSCVGLVILMFVIEIGGVSEVGVVLFMLMFFDLGDVVGGVFIVELVDEFFLLFLFI